MTRNARTLKRWMGSPMRILCASVTLCLSLLCVYSSFSSAISATGTDALTLWFFFAWGLGLVCGGVWLLRGRSQGEMIIFAPDRNRIMLFAFMFAGIVGLLIFLVSQPSIENDPWWPLILQTMFAVLFASLPFLLFDRADYRERNKPTALNGSQRQRMRKQLEIGRAHV